MPAVLILSVLLGFLFGGMGSTAEGRTAGARASRGSVPNLDIESGCRNLAHYDVARSVKFDDCIKEEHDAREQLQKSWRSVPPAHANSACIS
jgi:hypothetical protein